MLWIHGPGGVGDEVPLEAKKGGSFREPLSTILLTIVLGPGLRALIKKGHREERHVLRYPTVEMGSGSPELAPGWVCRRFCSGGVVKKTVGRCLSFSATTRAEGSL
jgi:hypothetical protein